jgi:hypothetical protein
LSANSPPLRIKFESGALGCLSVVCFIVAPFVLWMASYADLSESHSRKIWLLELLQSTNIGGFPTGGLLLGGYMLFEGIKGMWRSFEGYALIFSNGFLLLHPSYFKPPIAIANIISIEKTNRSGMGVKSINPSFIIQWRDMPSGIVRRLKIRNLDITPLEFLKIQELLNASKKHIQPESPTENAPQDGVLR